MEMKRLNKKGQLGIGVVKTSMIAFLVLAVLAVTITLSLTELRDVAEKIDQSTGALNGIQISTVINTTSGAYPTGLSVDTRACTLSVVTWYNTSNAAITYDAGNFSVVGCSIASTATAEAGFLNTNLVSLNGTFKSASPDTNDLTRNVTSGVNDFFNDTGTIFSILIVIVIILSIAIIIAVVSRFGGGSAGGISGSGSGGGDSVSGS